MRSVVLLLLFVALLLLPVAGCSKAGNSPLTALAFSQLKEGMTLAEVEAIIGPHTEIVEDHDIVKNIKWVEGEGDSMRLIQIVFDHDKATMLVSVNLRP